MWIVIKADQNLSRVNGCIYRPPNSSTKNNNKLIENILWINNHFSEVIVVGDFNLPTVNWTTLAGGDVYSSQFVDVLNDCGYEQLVSEYTRYREGQNPSLLDLIISSDPDAVENIVVADSLGKRDHCRNEFSVKNCFEPHNLVNHYRYNNRRMNEQVFEELISNFNWESSLTDRIENVYTTFTEVVNNTIHRSTLLFE